MFPLAGCVRRCGVSQLLFILLFIIVKSCQRLRSILDHAAVKEDDDLKRENVQMSRETPEDLSLLAGHSLDSFASSLRRPSS